MPVQHNLYIFTRDLRIKDNKTFDIFYKDTYKNPNIKTGVLLFHFNPNQCTSDKNPYFSQKSFNFLIDALRDLQYQTKSRVNITYGPGELKKFAKHYNHINTLFISKDYTPFSKNRLVEYKKIFKPKTIKEIDDYTLIPPETIDKPRKVFTPFYKKYKDTPLNQIKKKYKDLSFIESPIILNNITSRKLKIPTFILKIKDSVVDSSRLSKWLKYGKISIREAHYMAQNLSEEYKRQLFWRDFYYQYVWYNADKVFKKKKPLVDRNWKWAVGSKATRNFNLWKSGKTKSKLVNHLMAKLNDTGFITNRARLIVSNYLIHDLGVNWTLGERYFAQQLEDYDPIINLMNWIWAAGGVQYGSFNPLNIKNQEKKYQNSIIQK